MSQVAPKFSIPYNTRVNGHLYTVSTILKQQIEIVEDDTGNSVAYAEVDPSVQYASAPVGFDAVAHKVYRFQLRHKSATGYQANYIAPDAVLNGKSGGLNYYVVPTDDGGKAFDYNDAIFIIHWAQYK